MFDKCVTRAYQTEKSWAWPGSRGSACWADVLTGPNAIPMIVVARASSTQVLHLQWVAGNWNAKLQICKATFNMCSSMSLNGTMSIVLSEGKVFSVLFNRLHSPPISWHVWIRSLKYAAFPCKFVARKSIASLSSSWMTRIEHSLTRMCRSLGECMWASWAYGVKDSRKWRRAENREAWVILRQSRPRKH